MGPGQQGKAHRSTLIQRPAQEHGILADRNRTSHEVIK